MELTEKKDNKDGKHIGKQIKKTSKIQVPINSTSAKTTITNL